MTQFLFRNRETGEKRTVEGMIADAEAFEKDNPDWEWMCATPLIHSGRGLKKPDAGFRDVLKKVKHAHWKSDINTF